ncbi:transcription initiation factor TFIID subunit 7-like [Protopterus annectens]|uniref:transcription initiation factor TFIID subunit 7-like n=1 Tax=Protopterus annectens TaxID=7888 RepID=UPI001CF947A0|nr:transcription initiation factor TFIID subunit 7-like [Protopterus annectens]
MIDAVFIRCFKSYCSSEHTWTSTIVEYASTVQRAVQSGNVNLKDRLTIELHADGRHGIVRVDRVPLAAKLVDLPCIIESLKTIDKKTFYKTADISQMLVCTLDGDLYPPLEEPAGIVDPKNKKKDKDKEKKFIWNHGITAPLKNVRKRRFRKTAKKKYIESPDVEKEVKRLLSTDLEAVSVRILSEHNCFLIARKVMVTLRANPSFMPKEIELFIFSPNAPVPNTGVVINCAVSFVLIVCYFCFSVVEHDELREIFNDISSSSEDEEDEGDRHDDEDLNIMDTEEDLERLQDKMNDSDGQDQEKDRPNQIVLDFQKQIDHLKSKLLETQEKRKRQEDLIMKVENVALKTRLQLALDELKQQEEREKQQLASLNEQLESLLEK